MAPPLSQDLLLAAALASSLPAALAQNAVDNNRPRTGVATKLTQNATLAPTRSTMYIDGTTNQRLTTDANSTLHVLFSDQSAVTLGPNSELTIAKFEFNPQTKDGQILIDLTKGLLRVVGGLISKRSETVVRTSTATIGIRGGISIAETNGQNTSAIFLFGQSMRATDNNGNTQTITRQGFGTSVSNGQPPLNPQRVSQSTLSSRLLQFGNQSSNQSSANNNQPGGVPPGQLLSTGNTPSGGGSPGDTLANDRLQNVVDTNSAANPSQTLRRILITQTPEQS